MTWFPSLSQARSALAAGTASPSEVLAGCLGRIDASDATIRAWIHLDRAGAAARASELDAGLPSTEPLWGIPVGIKDVIDVAGLPTTAASRVLAGNMPRTDAAVVDRLRAAGAVILGKTNTQEFAYGAVTPPTTNPWDPGRIPGGSSGGSAAALAAGHCLGALGTDTAGSIRIPAALCGVVGLKPRPGLLPLDGVIPLAPSFDVVGPMARSVADVALLWEVLSGAAVDLTGALDLRLVSAPLASLPELEPGVESSYDAALETLRSLCGPVDDADIPAFGDFDLPRGRVLTWEALEVHRSRGWWPVHAGEYTEETRGYLARAEATLTPEIVAQARRECAVLAGRLATALDAANVLVTPTVPCEAPTHEEAAARAEGNPRSPIVMKLTRIPGPVNVAGLAALSVPCGVGPSGLPIGLQLIGRDEETVLRLGSAYEQAAGLEIGHERGM